MKYKEKKVEAVKAICASCGNTVEPDMQVSHDNLIHCRTCVKMGRIVDQPSLVWQYFYFLPQPGVPHAGPGGSQAFGITSPYPVDEPDVKVFKIGYYGAIFAGIMALLISIPIVYWAFIFGGNVIFVVAQLPFIKGIMGFNKNYGCKPASYAGFSILMGAAVYLVLSFVDLVITCSQAGTLCYNFPIYSFIGLGMMGIGYLVAAKALYDVRTFFVRKGTLRKATSLASILMMIGSIGLIIELLAFPLTFIGIGGIVLILFGTILWLPIGIGILIMAYVFYVAPIPVRTVDRMTDQKTMGPEPMEEPGSSEPSQ